MTGPGEPTRPELDGESGAPEDEQRPPSDRPSAPTGWPGRPEAARFAGTTPGSVLPAGGARPESFRVPPPSSTQPTGWTTPAPSRPQAPAPAPAPASAAAPAPAPTPPAPASAAAPSAGAPAERPTASDPVAPGPVTRDDRAGQGSPVRPPVPTGVPPRPSPLPPPRPTAPESVAGSLATPAATVVPEGVRRPAPRPTVSRAAPAARGRRAKLAVKRLDPWSVFVSSLVLSLLLGLITIIAAFVLYAVLSALGVPSSINTNIGDITKNQHILTQGKFVGFAALIAAANVLLLTALATIGAMLYNVVATFTGGLELTLSERD